MSEEPEKKNKQNAAVVNYIGLLFIAAFLLLFMTYLMETRQSAEILDGFRTSVSAMQSVEALYDENGKLQERVNQLEQELFKEEHEVEVLEEEILSLEEELEESKAVSRAMDWFWQVDEAFVLNRSSTAIRMIGSMEELGYDKMLPTVSVTENDRFSPAHRYLEIKTSLGLVEEED